MLPPAHTPDAEPRCIACDYGLTGLPAGTCPECGRPFDPIDPSTFTTPGDRPTALPQLIGSLLTFVAFTAVIVNAYDLRDTVALSVLAVGGLGLAIAAVRHPPRPGMRLLAWLLTTLWLVMLSLCLLAMV